MPEPGHDPGPDSVPGSQLVRVVAVMDRLRRECPWTRQQTHGSLRRYLLEETYETLEAIDAETAGEPGASDDLREELGDLLLQVIFHAAVAAESEGWSIDDVAAGLATKLVDRNPHVFADGTATTPAEIDAEWRRRKAREKGRVDPLAGVPATLPALARAAKVLDRLGDPPVGEEEGVGERMLALVAEARHAGIDPEAALGVATRRLISSAGEVNRR